LESGSRIEGGLLAVGIVLIAVFGAGAFVPRDPDFDFAFGVEGYRHLGAGIFIGASATLLSLLALRGAADRLARLLTGPARRIFGRGGALCLVAAFGAACWLLPNMSLSGDAGTVLLFAATERVHPSNALTCYSFRLLEGISGLDPVRTIRLASALSGALYAWCALAIGRECAPAGPRRVGFSAVLLATGSVALFFGTLEVYPPLVATTALYFLLGVRWLRGKGSGVAPPLCLGVAFCLHGSAGLLLPSLFLLANRARVWPIALRRSALWGAVFLVPVVVTFLVIYLGTWGGAMPEGGSELYGTFLGAEGEGPILPLLHSPHDPRQRYALLDLEHLLGLLNLLLLLAPVGFALVIVGPRRWTGPRFRFAAAAALFLLLLPVVWNVSYALRRDWDLFGSLGPPVALLGALAWSSVERRRESAVRVIALSLFCSLPFVLSNSLRPDERLAFLHDVKSHLGRAVPVVASSEIVREVENRAVERGFEPQPEAFWQALRGIVFHGLQETRALERTRPRLDPDRFREDLVDVLEPGKGLPTSGLHPARLASLLTVQLSMELRRIRERGWSPPSPGVIAAMVVRRAAEREELPQALGAPMDFTMELLLLDVLDEAMERGSGFSLERAGSAYGTWEAGVADGLRFWAAGEEVPLDVAAWAELVAVTVTELLHEGRAREEGLRWVKLASAADELARRERYAGLPGRSAAIARVEWIASLQGSGLERYATAERYARHWLEKAPGDPAWLYLLGSAVYLQGRRDEAIGIYGRTIQASPFRLPPRLDQALALRESGHAGEALRAAERSVKVDPWHPRCPFALELIMDLRRERGDEDIARSIASVTLRYLDRTGHPDETRELEGRIRRFLAADGP